MDTTNEKIRQQQTVDSDEINLLEYLYVIVKNKWLIIGLTIVGFIGGYVSALIKGPVYIADAVIAPKESESVKTPDLSGLGMFGGVVASQLNIGGNASLDKIDLILDSRSFSAELVETKDLLPLLFSEYRDSTKNTWIEKFKPPEYIDAGGYLRGKFLKKETKKNGTMTIKIENKDSLVSHTILTAYLEYLDSYIRKNVQEEAKENRDYLENQIINVSDPLLRAKFQELIAKEVEKMMVVSKEAFRVIDNVYTYKSFREKRLFPLIFAFGMFFLGLLSVVIHHAFSSGNKTKEDHVLIENIKKELFRISVKR